MSLFNFSPHSLSICNTLLKICSNWRCPVDPHCPFCCLQFLLQTNRMARPLSLTVCSADRSMGITVNTLSCFCWVVEFVDAGYAHQLLSSLPDQGFGLLGDSLSIPSCSKWSESLSAKINRLLLLLLLPSLLSPYKSGQFFQYILVASINQIINGLRGAGRIESQGGTTQWDSRVMFVA